MLTWTFAVTEGEHIGRQVKSYTVTTGKGSGRAKQVLKALGVDTAQVPCTFRVSQAVGRDVSLVIGIQKDRPDFNEVKRVNPPVAKNGGLGEL